MKLVGTFTCSDRVNAATGCPHLLVLLHSVNEQGDRLGLEVNVTVQGQQVSVLRLTYMPYVEKHIHTHTHRRRLWRQPGHVPPIIRLGAKPLFFIPIIQRRIFWKLLKREARDKEIKYYQKLIGN